jgi:lysozyme family protein
MKNLKVILGVILLSICGGIIARKMLWKTYKKHNGILNDYKKKLKIMGNLSKANLDYILKWEGGLSKHERDSASRYPVPDGSGNHTNKGITWRVFSSIHGSGADAIHRFYQMSQDDFREIYKLYWNGVKADLVQSQIIAEYMADFAWGSGVAGASRQVQKWLNSQGYKVGVDGKIGNQTVTAINQLIEDKGQRIAFESLDAHRRHFLSRLKDFDVFGNGWYNRLNDFVAYAYANT